MVSLKNKKQYIYERRQCMLCIHKCDRSFVIYSFAINIFHNSCNMRAAYEKRTYIQANAHTSNNNVLSASLQMVNKVLLRNNQTA